MVLAQMRIPFGDKRLRLVKAANGRAAPRSCTVTATIIELEIHGCERPRFTISQPVAWWILGGGALLTEGAAVALAASAQAATQRQAAAPLRAVITDIYAKPCPIGPSLPTPGELI